MILSIGNILTLLIVIIVLIIYRQLDRNNRSLDKVKRYSDKIKGDLDGFVEGKTTELKNVAIELDVQQKTAKEILKRISAIEDGLKGKTDGFDKIHARVTEYDKVLGELVAMTGKVDENLKRLHAESEFVDSVSKRVKETGVRIAAVEKSLPDIKDEFAKLNEKELREVSARVLKAAKDDVQAIDRQLGESERSVKSFSTYLSGLEAKRDALEAQTVKSLQASFQVFLQNAKDTSIELRKQFETNLTVLLEKATDGGKGATDRVALLLGQLKGEIAATERSLAEKLDAFQERVGSIEQTYQENLRDVAERAKGLEDDVFVQMKAHIEGRAREVQKQLAASLAETRGVLDEARKEVSRRLGESRSELAVWQAELQKLADDKLLEFNAKYETFRAESEERMGSYVTATDKEKDEQERELEAFIDEMRSTVKDLETDVTERLDGLASTVDDKEQSFKAALEDIEKRNVSLADSVLERFQANTNEFEERMNSRLVDVEAHVSEHEADVAYRFTKMEEANVDIEEMERNLRELMEKTKARITGDFDQFGRQLAERRGEERKKAEAELALIREDVARLEKGLAEIKEKAYESATSKLQVFEDDFFADLRARGEELKARLEEWQTGLQERLDELGERNERLREQIEREHGEELAHKLAELQSRTVKQYEQFEARVMTFEEGIGERIDLSDATAKEFEETIREDLAEAKQSSMALFKREFESYGADIGEQMRGYEREVDRQLKALGERVDNDRENLAGLLDAARAEVASWQTELQARLDEASGETDERLAGLKAAALGEIGQIREEFASQRSELIEATSEERGKLRSELSRLSADVARLEEELRSRGEQALSDLKEDRERFIAELKATTGELKAEADQKMREFRAFSAESFEKNEAAHKRLSSKVEESYRTLSLGLQEMEKKQKDFAVQSRIFERADLLKASLGADIEELKEQMGKLQAQAKDLREVEKNFQKIKKMGDEVSAKLSKFLAEKRRIEVMEGDFKKLLSMSQSVDTRLGQVTSSHDQLQTIQAQIRGLEDLEKDVLAKYERLDGKKEILDVTAEGVDKNFQSLEGLEKNLRSVEDGLAALPARITDLAGRIELLSKNKKEADQAVAQLQALDGMLKEIEERTEKMQSAREWLARTETRLEEIGQRAEEQVKLLGTLLKDEGKAGAKKGDKGAPSMSTRDMVTRLAHQGWKVPQIAQATKLSRGEVELILELLPKSGTSK